MLRGAAFWLGGAVVLAGLFLFGSASLGNDDDDDSLGNKVDVCHVRGQSGKTQTLSVAAEAVPAHLAHGDTLGACGTTGDDDDDFVTPGDDDDSTP